MDRRPRLNLCVAPRRHVVEGETIVSLHVAGQDGVMCVGEREWAVLRCADGTRDLDGIAAAVSALGRSTRVDHLSSFFDELERAGIIIHGVSPTEDELRFQADGGGTRAITDDELESLVEPLGDRPLDAPSNYSFRCNGGGDCCGTFPTILFSTREVLNARATCPEILDGGDREELAFTPECGALLDGPASSRTVRAVASIDGRCAYVSDDRRCSLHLRGGAEAKPFGCRTFPLSFVDDGEAIRVSVAPVCACVFTSLDAHEGGSLIPEGARVGADLDPRIYIWQLPSQIAITSSDHATRAELVDWSRRMTCALETSGPVEDAASMLWTLADDMERQGLNATWPDDCGVSKGLEAEPLIPWLEALGRAASRRASRYRHWRSELDLVVHSMECIERACDRLLTQSRNRRSPTIPSTRSDELLYLQMTFHGYHMIEEGPLVMALRDRAIRLLVGREMKTDEAIRQVVTAKRDSLEHPLAIVEALMRGHGLQGYLTELSSST